jgi:hypothetical protein
VLGAELVMAYGHFNLYKVRKWALVIAQSYNVQQDPTVGGRYLLTFGGNSQVYHTKMAKIEIQLMSRKQALAFAKNVVRDFIGNKEGLHAVDNSGRSGSPTGKSSPTSQADLGDIT